MKEKIKVNKLFLVGNGFDLALGLKTNYADFMFWLLKKQLIKAASNYGRQVAPKAYKGHFSEHHGSYDSLIIFGYSSSELFDVLIKDNYGKDNLIKVFNEFKDSKDVLNFIKKSKIDIVFKNGNGLFSQIYNQINVGWIDIEETYFRLVKGLINNETDIDKDEIDEYNEDLKNIILELNKYLREIESDLNTEQAKIFFEQFAEKVNDKDVFLDSEQKVDIENPHLYFLNFNYTESLQHILTGCGLEFQDYTINHIHGSFHEEEPIIFGFGDEMDHSYKKIEEFNDNRFFTYIKSFQYFQNSNYRNLLRFLNSEDFQVCIYGHSCGLSDRVMLNEIFEHENCRSIKIYFYKDKEGNNDFTTKTMNISRHFNSNKLMRQKIVEFNPENEIPQKNSQTELQ
jgi:predicted phosphodiesterase